MFDSLRIGLRGIYKPRLSILGAKYSPTEWYRHRNTEVFLVWFPKTGGTWVRLLLNSALSAQTGVQPRKPLEFDEFAVGNAGIPLIRALHEDEPHWKKPHQLSESKERFRDKRVILLVRDPRDTIVSLHFQMTKRWRVTQKQFSEFLWQSRGSFDTMIRYYNIWARNRDVPRALMLLRYEDLHEDCQGTLRKMLDFIGVKDVPEKVLRDAAFHNSIDELRKRETGGVYSTGRLQPGISGDPDSYKARRGKVGGFADYMSEHEVVRTTEIINSCLDPWYGYSSGTEATDNGHVLRTLNKTRPTAVNTTDLKRRVTPIPTPMAAE